MKSKVLDRPMFRKGEDPENTGIMQGFKDSLAEDDSGYDSGKMLSRTPRSPEILMNNLRGDMRSVDERLNELIDLVGKDAAYQTPPEVLTLLQPILKEQQAAGIAGLPPGPAGAPPGMPPGMPPMPPPGMPPMPPPGMPPMPPPGMPSMPPPPGPEAMGLGALPTAQGPEGAPPMQMAAGGYVQRFANGGYVQNFKDGSDQRGVTPPTSRAFSPQDMQRYAQLQIQSMLQEPAYVDVPDIEKATDKRVELYNRMLKRDPDAAKKDKYWALTEAFLNLASNTDPTTGRPMRGGFASRLGGAFKGTPSKMAAIEGEEGKQRQAIQMLALQGAEKDIEAAREMNAQLTRRRESAALRFGTAEGVGGGAGKAPTTYRLEVPGQQPLIINKTAEGFFLPDGTSVSIPPGADLYEIGTKPKPESRAPSKPTPLLLRKKEDQSQTLNALLGSDGVIRYAGTRQPVSEDVLDTYDMSNLGQLTAANAEGLGSPTKKEGEKLRSAGINVRKFIGVAGRMSNMLDENPDVNTAVASAGAILDDLRAEGTALARTLGRKYESTVFDEDMTYKDDAGNITSYADKLDSLGVKNRILRSLTIDLSFQRAAADEQTGQSVSNKDVDRYLMSIGANASNPEAFKAVLAENVRSVYDAYNIMHEEYLGEPVPDPERILGPRFAPMVLGTGEASPEYTGLTPEEEEQVRIYEEQNGVNR